MRTIKFRGKRVDKNVIVFGDLIHGVGAKYGKMFILPITHIYPSDCHNLDGYEVISETVGQFTGLQDKNGEDIYEGDILDGDGIVEWNDVEFCWSVKDKGYDGVDQWHSLQFKNCPIEITGNIHEGGINVL